MGWGRLRWGGKGYDSIDMCGVARMDGMVRGGRGGRGGAGWARLGWAGRGSGEVGWAHVEVTGGWGSREKRVAVVDDEVVSVDGAKGLQRPR